MSDIPTKTYPPAFLKALIDEAEAEALRRDARRYRWLRGMIYDDRIIVAADEMLHGEALDAVIDEAAAAATTTGDASAAHKGNAMSDITRFDIRCLAVTKRENGDWVRYENHLAEVERLTAERDEAQAEVERLKAAMSRCLLGDKPGDCYAAECVDLRAEVNRLITERNKAQSYVKWLIDERHSQASLDRSRAADEDIWYEAFMTLLRDDSLTVEEAADQAQHVVDTYRARWPR